MSGDAKLSNGTGEVKYFDEQVSPFVGFHQDYQRGFNDLFHLFPAGRKILYATPTLIKEPEGWEIFAHIKGLQFVLRDEVTPGDHAIEPVPLTYENVDEMVKLATLTKPGPFGLRTIDFGHYYGIFEDGKLAAMTGQRLHVGDYTEVSAVCTHPDHLGKGYAASLILHQLRLIASQGKKAFLHVRDDNDRAIAIYKRLGFEVSRQMNFYFMKRKG